MSATCLLSHTYNDLRCPVCGQGFLIFSERSTGTVREQVRRRAQRAMRAHHQGFPGAQHVHPAGAFDIADDNAGLLDWVGGLMHGMEDAAIATA